MNGGSTRRRFLVGLATAATLGGLALLLSPIRSRLGRRFRSWYAYRESPDLPGAPVGTLEPDVTERLFCVVEALVEQPLERTHYVDYFRWRAANLSGYRQLYLDLDVQVRRVEGRPGRIALTETPIGERRAMLTEIHDFWAPEPDALTVLFDKQAVLFRTRFVDEVMQLFAATDAWTILGYRDWPGVRRGLEHYTLPLPAAPGKP